MGVIWSLAVKDMRLLWRDRRSVVILLAMPFVFILVLGASLGEGFGQKPDDRLRVSLVDLDKKYTPPPEEVRPADRLKEPYPPDTWSKVVQQDLAQAAGIRLEIIPTKEEAERLIRDGRRSAVLIFGPKFSEQVHRCSFLAGGVNPLYRDGVDLSKLDAALLRDPTQISSSSIIEQVAQVSALRVVMPWMIGRAFQTMGDRMGKIVQIGITQLFPNYDFTAKTWVGLTRSGQERSDVEVAASKFREDPSSNLWSRGSMRYQILVPSYTVMFAFFLALTCGGLFAAERRQGTLKRLTAAPITRVQIVAGKLMPCILTALFQGLFLLTAGRVVFGMSWGEEPLWILAVVASTALATSGMALLIATLARTETQVMIYGTMIVLVMAGISGCLMPRDLMPEQMKSISRITPHAWALDAYSQLLLNPVPNLDVVVISCAMLCAFGVGFLIAAVLLLKLD